MGRRGGVKIHKDLKSIENNINAPCLTPSAASFSALL